MQDNQNETVTTLAEFTREAVKWQPTANMMQKDTGKGKVFSYLQWASAHAKAIEICPGIIPLTSPAIQQSGDATILTGVMPGVYVGADGTASVVAGVRFPSGEKVLETLAVLDFKNHPSKKLDAAEINNTIKRCYVKALALCGLGLTVFTGEDTLPGDADKKQMAAPSAAKQQQKLMAPVGFESEFNSLRECDTVEGLTSTFADLGPAARKALHPAAARMKSELSS